LVGTTASGKSAVALEVARRLGGIEIVTVDSMQVYQGMDIGTAKPTAAERTEIPHHLIDLVRPAEAWSVTEWLGSARAAIEGIESRGHRALLVGGTGLYFQALVDGLVPPPRFPDTRAELEREPDTAALYARLEMLDPPAAARIEPSNRRRILRALEVGIGADRPFSNFGPGLGQYPPTRWRLAGLWLPRSVVVARVADRLRAMIGAGLVAEVAALLDAPGGIGPTARQALGYREVVAHLDGASTLEEALDEATRRTVSFARRQRVWWRRDPRITWFGAAENPLAVVPPLLRNWEEP
jgi:tRNA dimethylallyltransferase